jgi:hypothetical protein
MLLCILLCCYCLCVAPGSNTNITGLGVARFSYLFIVVIGVIFLRVLLRKLILLSVSKTKQWMWREQFLIPLMMIAQRIQLKIIHPYKFIIIMTSHQIFIIRKIKNYTNSSMNLTPMRTTMVIISL